MALRDLAFTRKPTQSAISADGQVVRRQSLRMDGPLFGYDPPGANVFEAPGSAEPSSEGVRSRCPKGTLGFARFRSSGQSRACVDSDTATAHAFAPIAERDDGEGSQRVG